jgi:hypothetical protein
MAEADAVFMVRAKQGTPPPFIVLDLVGESEFLRNLAGSGGQWDSRVSVACHAARAADADAMAETIKSAIGDLNEYPVGDGGSPEAVLATVQTWMASASVFDGSEDGSVFRRLVDYGVRWRT